MSPTQLSTCAALAVSVAASTAFAAFDDAPLDLTLEGYWKARGVHIRRPFLGQANETFFDPRGFEALGTRPGRVEGLGRSSYLEHHMRLSPRIGFRKIAKLHIDLDLFRGVIWGDNNAEASLPLFATNPSNTGADGKEVNSIEAQRVWLELNVPVGIFRVGRMPSQWGMGLLANSGDGLDADFGDYRKGSTVDRILFATKPVQIAQTLMGAARPKSNLILALAMDKIVEDAIDDEVPDEQRLCVDESNCPAQGLLAKPNDDVTQFVGVLVYKNDKVDIYRKEDLVQAGVYVVHRVQRETQSKVWISDFHSKLRICHWGLETELLWISGTTNAIEGVRDIDIRGGAARGGYYETDLDLEFEIGRAPGDEEPTDNDFTGFPFHADYNVGLLMYEEILAARTAQALSFDLSGLRSSGAVWNSTYIYPKVRWRPSSVDGLTVIVALLWARAHRNNNAVWDASTDPDGSDLDLGYEVDAAIRYDFYGHAHFKLEGGVLFPGRALWRDANTDLQIDDDDKADTAWTIQARLAFEL